MSPSSRPGHHAPMPSLSSSISSCSSTSSSVLGMDVNGNNGRRRYQQQPPPSTTTGRGRRQQRRVSFNEQVVVLGDPRQQQKSCTLSTALLDAEQYCALTTATRLHHSSYAGDAILGAATATAAASAGTNRVSSDDNDYNWWSDESPLAVDLAEDDAMLENEAYKSRPWYRRKRQWWQALRKRRHCQSSRRCPRRQHLSSSSSHQPTTTTKQQSIPPSKKYEPTTTTTDHVSEKEKNHATSPTSSCIPSRPFQRISAACKKAIRTIVM
ncbi:predicted protein [Lichtheimia corymbifera JMRC:FSU:9682]|uniref:Uncharacterized protein n=1 Tax=Lichtheimia corymbifera JMRC:FSU:9682 TaxID=1263082 RepID=A0A068RXD9_9FUNG|nr:predicted protein [Lichtheimia corymbifera JMRC:FSU:9682]